MYTLSLTVLFLIYMNISQSTASMLWHLNITYLSKMSAPEWNLVPILKDTADTRAPANMRQLTELTFQFFILQESAKCHHSLERVC